MTTTSRCFGRIPSRFSTPLAFGLLAAGAIASLPGVALAEDDPRVASAYEKASGSYPTCARTPSKDDVETATKSHKQAVKYFNQNEFEKAIREWTNAYSFDCTRPSVFQNLANAYAPSDKAMAIALLEIYEQRDATAPKDQVEKRIADLRADLGRPPAAGASPPSGGPAPNPGSGNPPPDKPAPSDAKARPFGPAPWIIVGVGAATLVAGAAVLGVGRVKVGQAEDQCGGHSGCTPAQQDLGNTGNTMTGVGAGLLGGGAAIAVAGLIWQFAGNAPRPVSHGANAFTVVPALGPSGGGAFVLGSF